MIVSANIDGLEALKKRLDTLKSLPGLDGVLRGAAQDVRAQARENLTEFDGSGADTAAIGKALNISPSPRETEYRIAVNHPDGVELETGSRRRPEARWLGAALVDGRRKILERVRNYLRIVIR
ncbi:MAG: hypothetical protein K8F25_05475 [Fimbriimonadaceae bacterium]|nr:hypothetical protein [Alphaproteobacteria bacterium]